MARQHPRPTRGAQQGRARRRVRLGGPGVHGRGVPDRRGLHLDLQPACARHQRRRRDRRHPDHHGALVGTVEEAEGHCGAGVEPRGCDPHGLGASSSPRRGVPNGVGPGTDGSRAHPVSRSEKPQIRADPAWREPPASARSRGLPWRWEHPPRRRPSAGRSPGRACAGPHEPR